MKKLTAIFLSVLTVMSVFAGCSGNIGLKDETESETSTTTTARTTEDLSTTFKEAQTAEIYPELKYDSSGSYSFKLSSYTTDFDPKNETRTTNINNAVDHLNNVVIPDGETFSFNQVVGKRTVLAGYREAKVVVGDEFVDGLGGGICQVSSTVFQAALRANMKITVRACHSLEIGYVPLGGDATVQWNSQDFQFKNNCGSDIRLKVTASSGRLVCELYSKEKVNVGKVKINIDKNDSQYVLTRSVDGSVNYTTYSKYGKPKKTETTKKR